MSNSYLNFISMILKTLTDDKEKSSLSFFRHDNKTLEIYCKILSNHYQSKPSFIEELIKDAKFGSRITIKKIIDDAVAMNFLIKTNLKEDKRKNSLAPTDKMIEEYENYADQLRNALKISKEE